MAKSEGYGNQLIPLVLVAGILSGSLWRSAPPAGPEKRGDASSSTASETSGGAAAPASWISDLRPALESLDGALGARAGSLTVALPTDATGVALAEKGAARDQQIVNAMTGLRNGLGSPSSQADPASCVDAAALEKDARVLGAWMLAGEDDGRKVQAAEARAILGEYRDWRLLADLAALVKKSQEGAGHPIYSVDFIVATLPDYVDSNSGWLVDQDLGAVQSAMAIEGYLFDRVKLIDWSRAAGGSPVLSASRLHERQPGAIVFRHVDGERISLQVVLTVLETPTAGVHQAALRNSLRLLLAWNACVGTPRAPLRVLGPSFSGSIVSLATVLGEAPFSTTFSRRVVITGSATADENVEKMETFSHGAIFRATVHPTSVLMAHMADYLQSINATWKGENIALLTESNTAYGNSASSGDEKPRTTDPLFAGAKTFAFPLHIAQLRTDAPADAQPGAALMSGPAIPLNLRETAPPSDVIPALGPQLTSPIVESTVDSILDAIRHEKIRAVGIIATDDRDVLFLAREVKKAAPDVQLFLFNTHALYLHQDYVPYLRGAIVASSYALTLANQPEIRGTFDPLHRQPFQSMVSEGAFYAVRSLVWLQDGCGSGEPLRYRERNVKGVSVPVAPVSINVIGEDGYWTLTGSEDPKQGNSRTAEAEKASPGAVPTPSGLNIAPLPPLPTLFSIGAFLVLVFVGVHVGVMIRIKQVLEHRAADRSFLEWPLVRVLVPLTRSHRAARYHRFATIICFALLSLAAAWVVAIGLPFVLPSAARLVPFTAALTCVVVIYTAVMCSAPRLDDAAAALAKESHKPAEESHESDGFIVRVATMICFALLSLAAAWVVAIVLAFLLPLLPLLPEWAAFWVPFAAAVTCVAVNHIARRRWARRRVLPDPVTEPAERSLQSRESIVQRIALKLRTFTATEWTGWSLVVGMSGTGVLFLTLVLETAHDATIGEPGRLPLARIVGGGIVSPAALTIFLAAAMYTAVFTGVRRLSLIGRGYDELASGSSAFELLTGKDKDAPPAGAAKRGSAAKKESLASILDMPAQNMPWVYPIAVLLILLIAGIDNQRVTTIDGQTFSWFVMVGTWTTIGVGLLQLAQGLALWNTARSHLKRLAQTPIEKHLQEIAPAVPWDISLVPPRLTELMPVAHKADSVMRDCRRLAFVGLRGADPDKMLRDLGDILVPEGEEETRLGARPQDLASLEPLFARPSHVSALENEMAHRKYAAIIQSDSWFSLWRLSDSLVTMLRRTAWLRSTTPAPAVARRPDVAIVTGEGGVPLTVTGLVDAAMEASIKAPSQHRSAAGSPTEWVARCEQLVALQMAFVLRDIVARTITCLFAAMLCLTSLTTAHLLYVFSGRASLLTVDMVLVGVTALAAVWILVDMERDHVLSRLRTTTPGRVDINWEFVKRIAVYGVLPLLAVIASLFPEVGGTLFGWLEPLRKLSSL